MFPISYQLYSSREFPPLRETAIMLADAGYDEVEGYGGVFDDPTETRSLLDDHGLKMTSAHFGLDRMERDLIGVVETSKDLGISAIYCPFLAEADRPIDVEGWKAFANRLEVLAQSVQSAGFDFGWHNHDFEFKTLENGSTPQQIILENAPSLSWEADIAWIVRGGGNAAEWIERFGDRMTAVHIKDIASAGSSLDEDGWSDVGHGTLDWPNYLRLLKTTPVRRWVMEHDKPSDDARFANRSIEAVRRWAEDLS